MDRPLVINDFECKMIAFSKNKVLEGHNYQMLLNPVIVAYLELVGSQIRIPADAAEYLLHRLHRES